MNTPIVNFVKEYAEKNITRFHMPGHKGQSFVGVEKYDITEVAGADDLYMSEGIIAQSEDNATKLFGTGKTVYSTEGSSQCIRAMLYMALMNAEKSADSRPYIIAYRNAHKAFIYAAALLDIDVVWLYPDEMSSLCSCMVHPMKLEEELAKRENAPIAVYVTTPDYLGGMNDVGYISEICHRHNTMLIVDNAHGAYLRFLEKSLHPMDLGADLCCDSAHKTFPVLTGGAYLHIHKNAPNKMKEMAKQAMALFGSTSPSYLILQSLDLCNQYLSGNYKQCLKEKIEEIKYVKAMLIKNGWNVLESDPLKLTISAPDCMTGQELAEILRFHDMECEYSDAEYVVCMITPENDSEQITRLVNALGENKNAYSEQKPLPPVMPKQACSVREAIFGDVERVSVKNALGRICGAPLVSCPPAIPIVISGELIDENAIEVFKYYGIIEIDVLKNKIIK